MRFDTAIKTCITRATFSGRARRSEFWYFFLFGIIGVVAISILDVLLEETMGKRNYFIGDGLIDIFSLLLAIPSIAVTCRRLHDINASGWWQAPSVILGFAIYIPAFIKLNSGTEARLEDALVIAGLVFYIPILIVCIIRGKTTDNKYGESPYAQEAVASEGEQDENQQGE